MAAGLAAQTVQVVCLREIFQVARGGEAVLGLALAAWCVGTGLGAATWRGGPRAATLLLLALPCVLLPVLRSLPPSPGSWSPGAALLAAAGAYAPGALFAAILRRSPARPAVIAEAAGACLAGVALTFLLVHLLPALTLLLLTGLLCWAALGGRRLLVAGAIAASLPAGWGLDALTLPRRARQLWGGSRVAAAAESPYARLLWLERGGQRSLFANGRLALTVPDEAGAEAFVHVVMAAHPNPRRVLVLGPGVGGVLRECARHPVEELEVALQDRKVLELVRRDLPEADRAALARAAVRFGDPRRVAAAAERDVVLVLAPPPLTLATNRTYTREFFAALRLRPGGMVAFQLPAAPHAREGEVLARNVAVFRALGSLHAVVLPGARDLFLASPGRAPDATPAVLLDRLRARGITFKHHAADFFAEPYRPEEVARVTAVYRDYPRRPAPAVPFRVEETPQAAPPAVLPNRDLHPGAVLHSAGALAREEQIPLLRAAAGLSRYVPWLLLPLAGAGAVLAWRRGRRAAAALATSTSGAASMGLWIVVLMAHQARVGALYGDLALLAATFMAGFAGGARLRARAPVVDAAFVLLCGLVWLALPDGGRALYVALTALVGAAGGATLGTAVAGAPRAAPALYAWDMAGAAIAAVSCGTFLVPALGAGGACATLAGLKFFSWLGNVAAR